MKNLLATLAVGLLAYNLFLLRGNSGMFGALTHVIQVMQIVIGVEILFFLIYAIALLARLNISMKPLLGDAFAMAHKHLLTTFLCALVLYAAFMLIYSVSLAFILVIIAPAWLAVVSLMEKQVLAKYIPDEDELEE